MGGEGGSACVRVCERAWGGAGGGWIGIPIQCLVWGRARYSDPGLTIKENLQQRLHPLRAGDGPVLAASAPHVHLVLRRFALHNGWVGRRVGGRRLGIPARAL